MLATHNLSYRYQDESDFALQEVNLDLQQGQVIAIIGANGSGKSTLFMTLLGLLKPTSGQVWFNGRPLNYDKASLRELRQKVAMVFQDPDQQIFYSDIASELAFTLRNLAVDEAEIKRRTDWALDLVEGQSLRDKPVQYLSYGQKKRIAIAGALMLQSDCLLLDEPTAGLDPRGRDQMINIINTIAAQGTRVVISSHDIDLIYQISDYLYVLNHGRMIANGDPQQVFLDSQLMQQAHLTQPWLVKLHLHLGLPLYKHEQQLFTRESK